MSNAASSTTRAPIPPIAVTAHAVDRFEERWDAQLILQQPTEQGLLDRLPGATFVEFEQGSRQEIWRTDDGILLVVLAGTVRTVLPPGSVRPNRQPRR